MGYIVELAPWRAESKQRILGGRRVRSRRIHA